MSLSATVTKDCFPPATQCHNCMRKRREGVTKEPNLKQDLKRCASCHLFTYCDRDCQREHWKAVHKNHCKILSGREVVPNTKHSADSCPQCIKEKDTTAAEFSSGNSPKVKCHVRGLIVKLREALGDLFEFHGEGKACNCSLTFACALPFPMGELSGQFMDDFGLELMIAHAIKILQAMGNKIGNREDILERLAHVWGSLISSRLVLWWNLLLRGELEGAYQKHNHYHDLVNSVKDFYGVTNPWWKALGFSTSFIKLSNDEIMHNSIDSSITADPRFKNLKLTCDYSQSQRQKKAILSASNQWERFKLWPTIDNNCLTLVLPGETCCQGCFKSLNGSFSQDRWDSLPTLMPCVGESGALMACCPSATNPKCLLDCSIRNEYIRMILDHQLELSNEELKKFCIESRGCDFCLKLSLSSHRCSGCLAAQYCSTHCQHEDLHFHKTVCSKWAKEKSRRIASGKTQMKTIKTQMEELDGE